jgi:hypothetical protein
MQFRCWPALGSDGKFPITTPKAAACIGGTEYRHISQILHQLFRPYSYSLFETSALYCIILKYFGHSFCQLCTEAHLCKNYIFKKFPQKR